MRRGKPYVDTGRLDQILNVPGVVRRVQPDRYEFILGECDHHSSRARLSVFYARLIVLARYLCDGRTDDSRHRRGELAVASILTRRKAVESRQVHVPVANRVYTGRAASRAEREGWEQLYDAGAGKVSRAHLSSCTDSAMNNGVLISSSTGHSTTFCTTRPTLIALAFLDCARTTSVSYPSRSI